MYHPFLIFEVQKQTDGSAACLWLMASLDIDTVCIKGSANFFYELEVMKSGTEHVAGPSGQHEIQAARHFRPG